MVSLTQWHSFENAVQDEYYNTCTLEYWNTLHPSSYVWREVWRLGKLGLVVYCLATAASVCEYSTAVVPRVYNDEEDTQGHLQKYEEIEVHRT